MSENVLRNALNVIKGIVVQHTDKSGVCTLQSGEVERIHRMVGEIRDLKLSMTPIKVKKNADGMLRYSNSRP